MNITLYLAFSLLVFCTATMLPPRATPTPSELSPSAKELLSEYGFFKGDIAAQIPQDGVIPYQLNTPLFSDYAEKLRFVRLPPRVSVAYNARDVLHFPVGTVLIKTFYYPKDFRQPALGRRLIETRLLIHEAQGWKALTYIWNDAQTDATLEVAGDTRLVRWIDVQGKSQQLNYTIPNLNQCKGCHNTEEKMMPIGPSARQLNGEMQYTSGRANQLIHWKNLGLLTELPNDLSQVPKTPVWDDPSTGSLEARARAWLDINCAHCHRPSGPARTSGLHLEWHETDPTKLGIMKPPVAAGKGSGNRKYGIVPQKPEASILIYRLETNDPGEMMPELGRSLTHRESLTLLKEWIKSMR